MKNLSASMKKIEGWKYTSLFALDQKDWNMTEIHCVSSKELNKIDMFAMPEFDNEGDRIIANQIISHASPRQLMLGSDRGEIETGIDFDLLNGQAYAALLISASGEYPLTLTEKITLREANYNALQLVKVDAGSELLHIRLIDSDDESILFAPVFVQLGEKAKYTQILLSKGAKLARMTVQAELRGEESHADLRAVHRLGGMRHMDQSIGMRHMLPHCTSSQSIRYIVDEEAQGTFQGKIHVARDAQKTAAYQLCKSLLLSERAQVNTKPELEIYADDVKCSHGATTGALDERAMFYLQSRGIPKEEAQNLLMQAFIEDAFEGLSIPDEIRAFIA